MSKRMVVTPDYGFGRVSLVPPHWLPTEESGAFSVEWLLKLARSKTIFARNDGVTGRVGYGQEKAPGNFLATY